MGCKRARGGLMEGDLREGVTHQQMRGGALGAFGQSGRWEPADQELASEGMELGRCCLEGSGSSVSF